MKKRRLSRSTITLLTCTLAVPTVPQLIFGMNLTGDPRLLKAYMAAGALLGCLHLLIRPALRVISAPIGCLTFGLSGMVIDVGLIYLAAKVVKGFEVPGFFCALLTAMLINAITAAFAR